MTPVKIKAPALRRLNDKAICASKRAYTQDEALAVVPGHDCRKCHTVARLAAYQCRVNRKHWHVGHKP